MANSEFEIRHHGSIRELSQKAWACLEDPQSPFADFEFLTALEDSRCVGPQSGQVPRFITLWRNEELLAAVCTYVKSHSYGEYIFDWAWAEAAARARIPYYEKLVVNTPFTPASCRKLLCHSRLLPEERLRLTKILAVALDDLTKKLGLSSTHLLFIQTEELASLPEHYLSRHSFQYHWKNPGYRSFEDFLSELKSRKAKQIRKERSRTEGLVTQCLTGSALNSNLASEFYRFYLGTIEEKSAIPYLNEEFFQQVFATMSDRLLLVRALHGPRPIAAALFFHKGTTLYGRYWGRAEEQEYLHFELCYYQGMDFAIARGLSHFEAGAQGEHKVSRGFAPTRILSAHRLEHAGLHEAVKQFIVQEKTAVAHQIDELSQYLPYRVPELK